MVIGSINSIICTNDCYENKRKEVRRNFQKVILTIHKATDTAKKLKRERKERCHEIGNFLLLKHIKSFQKVSFFTIQSPHPLVNLSQ